MREISGQLRRFSSRLLLGLGIGITFPTIALADMPNNILFDNTGQLYGWVFDTTNTSSSVNIEVFLDGDSNRGTYLGTFPTNDNSQDVNDKFGITGAHRFSWKPSFAPNSAIHLYYVYAVDGSGNKILLNNQSAFLFPDISIQINPAPQSVFDAATQGCDANDFADHPARAFRTADGNVSFLASWINTRRSIGKGLNSLIHKCDIIYASKMDIVYKDFNYMQWLQSPYTVDGKTVYNITHNEWYGTLANPGCNGGDSWVSALSLTVSTDMGATFTRPKDYLIRYPKTIWSTSFPCNDQAPTRYGDLGGSNVIYKDGFYYKFFYYEPEPVGDGSAGSTSGWQCLMRTANLGYPSIYHVLTTGGWVRDRTAPCMPVAGINFFRSVTYNTYLKKYIALMRSWDGFYYSMSDNIIDWSTPEKINIPQLDPQEWCYPVLLDPSDESMNFEFTGQAPFLYYMIFNLKTFNRTQMRVRFKFFVPNGDPSVFAQNYPGSTNVAVPVKSIASGMPMNTFKRPTPQSVATK